MPDAKTATVDNATSELVGDPEPDVLACPVRMPTYPPVQTTLEAGGAATESALAALADMANTATPTPDCSTPASIYGGCSRGKAEGAEAPSPIRTRS